MLRLVKHVCFFIFYFLQTVTVLTILRLLNIDVSRFQVYKIVKRF